MKKIYQEPATEIVIVTSCRQFLAGSPIVKEEESDPELESLSREDRRKHKDVWDDEEEFEEEEEL